MKPTETTARQANVLYEIAKRIARYKGFPHAVTVASYEKLLDLKPRQLVNYREKLRMRNKRFDSSLLGRQHPLQ